MNLMHTSRRSVVAALAAAGLLAVAAACSPVTVEQPSPPPAPVSQPNELNTDSLSLLSQSTTAPVRLVMPDLSIDMSVEPHGLDDVGEMSLPVSPFTAGWYAYGSAPDSVQGSTVIAAHVDSLPEGKGPFSRLRDAVAGMTITVIDELGIEHVYRVTEVERIAKAEVPLNRVFTGVGEPHLVLVTCGGEWNSQASSYRDNYIVTAEKVT